MPILRGDVYFVELGPTRGREINNIKKRPVVVMSVDDLNRKPLVVAVVPGTTRAGDYRNVVRIAPNARNGLTRETFFQCHQIRALDHSRFPPVPDGALSRAEMRQIEEALRFCLGL